MSKKYAFITGASRGIGRATALAFAHAGYHVFINCKHSVSELQTVQEEILSIPGATCDMVIGDVGKSEDVTKMFKKVYDICPALDVLVNNAGISHIGLLSEMKDKEWEQLLQTNLSSVFYCCRAAVPKMVSQKKGRIINISSIWGVSGASCEAAYSATKAGVNGLTKALAKELAPSNIQVNALSCGVIETDMNKNLSPEERLSLEIEIPAGRFGTPQEIADVVIQLCDAPAYLTGQIIGVDGGFI